MNSTAPRLRDWAAVAAVCFLVPVILGGASGWMRDVAERNQPKPCAKEREIADAAFSVFLAAAFSRISPDERGVEVSYDEILALAAERAPLEGEVTRAANLRLELCMDAASRRALAR